MTNNVMGRNQRDSPSPPPSDDDEEPPSSDEESGEESMPPSDEDDEDPPDSDADDESVPDDDESIPPDDDDDDDIPVSDDDDIPPSDDDDAPPDSDEDDAPKSEEDDELPPSSDDEEPPLPPPIRKKLAPPTPDSDPEESEPESDEEPAGSDTHSFPSSNIESSIDEPVSDEDDPESDFGEEDDDDEPPPPPPRGLERSKSNLLPQGVAPKNEALKPQPPKPAPPNAMAANLDSLSFGLNVPKPPQLHKGKAGSVVEDNNQSVDESKDSNDDDFSDSSSPSSEDEESEDDTGSEPSEEGDKTSIPSIPSEPDTEAKADIAKSAIARGFIACRGKYESDPFEPMFLKVEANSAVLQIIVEQGEHVEYELVESNASVYEDSDNPNTFILEHCDDILIFQFETVEVLTSVMKKMPAEVFEASEPEPPPPPPHSMGSKTNTSNQNQGGGGGLSSVAAAAAFTKAAISHAQDDSRVKGASVEDLLEEDFEGVANNMLSAEYLGLLNIPSVPNYMRPPAPLDLDPNRRKELIESYIRKPRNSARRVTLLCEWINSLCIWPSRVTIKTLYKDMCNGNLLLNILKTVNPSVKFKHINERALTKRSAIENLEQALGHIWRAKSLNNSRIPTALDIYSGKTSKIAILLNEYFGVYVQRPLYKSSLRILKWYNYILKQYLRPLPNMIFDEGDLSGVWPHFQSGTALFCVLYHFIGPNMIGTGEDMVRVDPFQVTEEARTLCDFKDNLTYVFKLLKLIDIPVLWGADDWMTNPDTEFIMLQLSFVYQAFKFSQCVLPPAMGDMSGLSSGPNGEPIVAGVLFADSKPKNVKFQAHQQGPKAVLMGDDSDSLPIMPLNSTNVRCSGTRAGRFLSTTVMDLPLGMVSNKLSMKTIAKLPSNDVAPGDVKISLYKTKKPVENSWNACASVSAVSELDTFTKEQAKVKSILKEQNSKLYNQEEPLSPGKLSQTNGTKASTTSPTQQQQQQQKIFEKKKRKEIESAILKLEEEMKVSQAQLDTMEDVLASRYMDLEAQSNGLDMHMYEELLNDLEAERKDLEEEQFKLQDHFAKKLASIKQVYIETTNKDSSLPTSPRGSPSKRSQLGLQGSPPKSPSKKTTMPPMQDKKEAAALEKGWVHLTTKMETHNFHLKSTYSASSSALKARQTPKLLREREERDEDEKRQARKQVITNHTTGYFNPVAYSVATSSVAVSIPGTSLASTVSMSPEEAAKRAFARFKTRLQGASVKWQQSKTQVERPRLQDHISATPVKHFYPSVELIALPEKSVHAISRMQEDERARERDVAEEERRQAALESEAFSQSIQLFELNCLQYEDERGGLWMAEQGDYEQEQEMFHHSGGAHSDASSLGSPGRSPRTGGGGGGSHQQQQQQSYQPSTADVEAAYSALSLDMPITVADRVPRDYVFAVTLSTPYLSNVPQVDLFSPASVYTLEWRERGGGQGGDGMVVGCIAIAEIQDIFLGSPNDSFYNVNIRDNTAHNVKLTIIIGESVKALKSSRGRTSITLKFDTPQDCARYYSYLVTIRQFLLLLHSSL